MKNLILSLLNNKADVEVADVVSSTNNVLKSRCQDGDVKKSILVATEQTAGRGRLDRTFFSGASCGVYFSFVVPDVDRDKAELLTIITALAVHNTLSNLSTKTLGIKWVNDVYADGKKCAGILVEGARNLNNGSLNYAIVGVGINLREPSDGYPTDIKDIAGTALVPIDVVDGIEAIIVSRVYDTFWDIYLRLDKADIISQYRAGLFMLDREVVAVYGDKEERYIAKDVDADGRLVLVDPKTKATTLLSIGEVRLKI